MLKCNWCRGTGRICADGEAGFECPDCRFREKDAEIEKGKTENTKLREALESVAGAAHECLKNEWCPDLAVVALECIKKTASNILAETETDRG